MKNLNRSTIEVVATAVEKDTLSLKKLLLRNGVNAISSTKDQLQKIVTSALQESDTFRKEFRDWVVERSGITNYVNADGNPITDLFGLPFSSGAAAGVAATAGANSGSSTTTTTPPPAQQSGGGFFSGVTLNSLLDFAKNGLNNYTSIVTSKNDKAMVDAAIEKERLNQATTETTTTNQGKSKTALYVVGGILGVAVIGYAIYHFTKK